MRPAFDGHPAGADFLFVRQQAGFQNHLHRVFVGGLDHVAQLAENVFVFAVLVNLLRTVVNGRLGFKPLGVGGHRAERKADHAGDLHIRPFQKMPRLGDARAVDADGEKLVLARLGAELFDVLGGGVGLQHRVVNEGGKLRGGKLSSVHGHNLATDETQMKHRFFATRRRCRVNVVCATADRGVRSRQGHR